MVVCDRCLGKNATTVAAAFRKFDGTNRQGREMIRAEMVLCETCITECLRAFGKFKAKFMAEPDAAEVVNAG